MSETILQGRYVLGPVLGRGGMAEVRRARDTRLERDVAIKRLRVDLAGDEVFQERFRREARAAANLSHPNIVAVYDNGEQADPTTGVMIPYIVMELINGQTLREMLREGHKIPPTRALQITQQVLEALDYSHNHGIIHRDIKPANVMVTPSGDVKVMDFGIARAVSDTQASMTQTASVIGTPQYLSPEQIRGEPVDRRSDVYSTGCLLYELLTGKPPFEGDSPVSLAYQHVRKQPTPPSSVDPMISANMDAIVLKSLAKDPTDRYQTAKAMADDIGLLLAGQQVTAVLPAPVFDDDTANNPRTRVITTTGGGTVTRGVITTTGKYGIEEYDDYGEMAPPQAERPGANKALIIGLICALVVVLATGLGIAYWLTNERNPTPTVAMVTVPRVLTMSQTVATQSLAQAGFDVSVEMVKGPDDNTVGTVIEQDPAGETPAESGSRVTIRVNQGPDKVTIPTDLRDQNCEAASSRLTDQLGFTNVTISPASDEDASAVKDTVISVNPAGGAAVTKDTPITLSCATGLSEIPNVIGMTQVQATRVLTERGFPQPETRREPSAETNPDLVIGQEPVGGTGEKVDRATTVVVLVLPMQETEPTIEPTLPTGAPEPSELPASIPPATSPPPEEN